MNLACYQFSAAPPTEPSILPLALAGLVALAFAGFVAALGLGLFKLGGKPPQ